MIHILLWYPVCSLLPRAFPSLSAGARLALPSAAAAPGCKSCYLTSCCALPLPLPSQYGACGGGGGGCQLSIGVISYTWPLFLPFLYSSFLISFSIFFRLSFLHLLLFPDFCLSFYFYLFFALILVPSFSRKERLSSVTCNRLFLILK